MLIEEILRSCASEPVAQAAVASIGRSFAANVRDVASSYGMSVGTYTTLSVERFARQGDEAEFRAVLAAMAGSQEPLLAGLQRILCIMIAAGIPSGGSRAHGSAPRSKAHLCRIEPEPRREAVC